MIKENGVVIGLLGSMIAMTSLVGQEPDRQESRAEYVSTAKQNLVLHDKLKALPGTEARILEVEFPAGWVGERHYHTGDVFVYVLEGEFVVDVEGEGRLRFGPGEVYHEALNTIMQARNLSAEIATKIILMQVGKEGEPLMIRADSKGS